MTEFTFEKDAVLFVDANRGIYIPKQFAETITTLYNVCGDVDDEDFQILEAGPDHEDYWGTWEMFQDNTRIVDTKTGIVYTIWHDGDCWLVPEGCAIPE